MLSTKLPQQTTGAQSYQEILDNNVDMSQCYFTSGPSWGIYLPIYTCGLLRDFSTQAICFHSQEDGGGRKGGGGRGGSKKKKEEKEEEEEKRSRIG